MKRHRNIEQMTEQGKNSKGQINKEEIRQIIILAEKWFFQWSCMDVRVGL